MKQIFLFLCFLIVCLVLYPQNNTTDSSVTCISYWKKGDTKNLIITKTSEKLDAGKRQDYTVTTYAATIRIIDSTEKSFTVEWKNKNNNDKISDPSTKALNDLFYNLRVVYRTDELGAFDSLINYEEIKTFVNQSIETLKKIAADKDEFEKVLEKMKIMFQSRESIQSLVLRDISIYHSPFGVKYFSRKQQYSTQLPNFLGGDPFPAILSLYLVKQDVKADIARIAIDQEIDQKKGASLIKEILNKLQPDSANKIKDDELLSYIAVNDHNEFDIILSTGWLKRAYYKRVVNMAELKKIETYEIVIK